MIKLQRLAPLCFLVWLAVNSNAVAVKTWYFENPPDPSGAFDLKVPVSPATVSSWTICETKGFSVSPTDKDYWTEPGGTPCAPTLHTGTGMNSSFSYFWAGTTAYVELVGSQTASNTSYRAIGCGATVIWAWSVDLDPNNGADDRQDFELFGNTNLSLDPAEVTIVKLGPDFTGHATPTKSIDTGIAVSCTGDYGGTLLDFDKNSTADFDFAPKTKADCNWYPQTTTLRVRAHAKTCAAEHTWTPVASSHTEWCEWNCINQNYPTYRDIPGNESTACTQIHEDYHANEDLATSIAAIDPATYLNTGLPIVCDTRETEAQAKTDLANSAKDAAENWYDAVHVHWLALTECSAYNAEAACHAGLSHTDPAPGPCNACNTYGLAGTGC